jgi:hypothetical protein
LDFFTEHPEKLEENSWINLFHFLLFDSSCLLNEFSDDRRRELLLQRMDRFFKTQIANATARERDDCVANLIWIARSVQRYFEYAALQNPSINIPQFVSADHIIALLRHTAQKKIPSLRENATAEERKRVNALLHEPAVVYEAITASLEGCFDRPLSTEEEKKFIAAVYVANLLRKKYPVPPESGELCRLRSNDAEKTAVTISKAERNFLENPTLLNLSATRQALFDHGFPLLQEVFPELVRYEIEPKEGTDFVIRDQDRKEQGAILFCDGFISQIFQRYDQALSDRTIRALQDKNLFPSENFDFGELRCRRESGNVEEISYREKQAFIRVSGEDVQVKPSWSNGRWLIYEDPSSWLENHALRNYICLRSQEEIIFCDPESYEVVYRGSIRSGELCSPVLKTQTLLSAWLIGKDRLKRFHFLVLELPYTLMKSRKPLSSMENQRVF